MMTRGVVEAERKAKGKVTRDPSGVDWRKYTSAGTSEGLGIGIRWWLAGRLPFQSSVDLVGAFCSQDEAFSEGLTNGPHACSDRSSSSSS